MQNNTCWLPRVPNLCVYWNNKVGVIRWYVRAAEWRITPRSRVVLEKLISLELAQKFLVFYGTRNFITAFTTVHLLSFSWASLTQSTSHPFYISIIPFIFPHIYASVFQLVPFLQISPPNLCMHLSVPLCVPHAPSISFPLISSFQNFVSSESNIKRTSMSAVLTSANSCRVNLPHGINIEFFVFAEIKYGLFCVQ
jgi:hypothetical protein